MKKNDVSLGDIVKDSINGYKGTVIAIADWLNGCRRVVIQSSKLKDDGAPVENYTVDVEQLVMVKPKPRERIPLHGGPRIDPVQRKNPTR